MSDKETIHFPSGTQFVGIPDKNGSSTTDITLRLKDGAAMPPKPGCVIATADIVENPKGEKLTRASKLRFNWSGNSKAGDQPIPTMLVTAADDFK